MSLVSDIKLIRTDTTLDLSQKAEKGMLLHIDPGSYVPQAWVEVRQSVWDALMINTATHFPKLVCSQCQLPGVELFHVLINIYLEEVTISNMN